MPQSHPLFAAAQAKSTGGRLGLGAFWEIVHAFLVARIDEPAEREAVEAAALATFDAFVVPRLGTILAALIRPTVKPTLDAILISLATA